MRFSLRVYAFAFAIATLLTGAQSAAQSTASSQHTPGSAATSAQTLSNRRWMTSTVIKLTSEYSDNAFLLPDSRKGDLATPSAGDIASGRYTGMSDAAGVTTIVTGAVLLRGPGILGRALEFRPEISLAADLQNEERRSLDLGVSLSQKLARGGELRLVAHSTPSYFMRNYLIDATDANGDGVISAAERRYFAGRHREIDASFDYKFRVNKSTAKSPFGASARLGAGYYSRTYDAQLSGRDLSGPTAEARVLLDLSRRFGIDLVYGFRSLAATPDQQVMVVDESSVGRDLNGNLTTTDQNVRVSSLVDRSRTEHSAGLRAKLDLTQRSDLRVEVERRLRWFSSELLTDFAHNERRDARNQVSAEMTFALRRSVRLSIAAEHSKQVLRRGIDSDVGEIDDYSRNRIAVGLRFGR